jgi:hypothetical protein
MDIPINPLYSWSIALASTPFIIGLAVGALALCISRRGRVRSLIVTVVALAGLASTLTVGIHQFKDWRIDTAATLKSDYGLELAPGQVVALLNDEQEVTATDSNGAKVRVKLVGDYTDGGNLVKTGDEIMKTNN